MNGPVRERLRIGLSPAFGFAHYGEKIGCEEILTLVSTAKKLGFCGFQLETYSEEQIGIYTRPNTARIREAYARTGLESSQFIAHSLKSDLASMEAARNRQGMEKLKRLVDVCVELGMIHVFSIPSAPPPEFVAAYTETYPGAMQPVIRLPHGSDWNAAWQNYAHTVSLCLEVVRKAGMRLAIEGVPYGVVSSPDSFLRFAQHLGDPADLGFILDTGHVYVHKEPLHVAIHKLRGRVFGTHINDNDGCIDDHWMPPKGSIDWSQALQAFLEVGYDGPLDLEVNIVDDPNRAYEEGKRYLEGVLAEIRATTPHGAGG